ncbi:unnamed protein product [Arabis nemorensis]|uniref:F-box domain-containing protein n=1 Tax=Arabis nemorensis TaxID=586526 RepID=A0A565APQ4_9BRAS|nr:unnamed protein product [Arabis nemorensis]
MDRLTKFDLKMMRLPAKFVMKTLQKKLLCHEKDKSPSKFDLKIHKRKLLCHEKEDKSPSKFDLKKRNLLSCKLDPIPLDLEYDILTRLPAKSLIKFRCVSKMWSSLIRSQRFVDSFFSLSSTRPLFTIVVSNGVFVKGDAKRLLIFSSSHDSLVANLDMTLPSATLAHGSKCPSVHGFVGCLDASQFTICNPTTRQVITVPCKGLRTSLGYDPIDGQFKALTMMYIPPYLPHDPGFLVHEVVTIKGDKESSWRRNQITSRSYLPVTSGLCINGVVYYAAWVPTQRADPMIVCFHVRSERLSFIQAPRDVVVYEGHSVLIEYKGKLASIVRNPRGFTSFDLWILEDVEKHGWSKQTFELPFPLANLTSPGTNMAGEIIFSPQTLSHTVQPFYIFYYNVETKDTRRVSIQGVADTEEFRRRYGLVDQACGGPSLYPLNYHHFAELSQKHGMSFQEAMQPLSRRGRSPGLLGISEFRGIMLDSTAVSSVQKRLMWLWLIGAHGQNTVELYSKETSLCLMTNFSSEQIMKLLRWKSFCGKNEHLPTRSSSFLFCKTLLGSVTDGRGKNCSSWNRFFELKKDGEGLDSNDERERLSCSYDLHLSAWGCKCSTEDYAQTTSVHAKGRRKEEAKGKFNLKSHDDLKEEVSTSGESTASENHSASVEPITLGIYLSCKVLQQERAITSPRFWMHMTHGATVQGYSRRELLQCLGPKMLGNDTSNVRKRGCGDRFLAGKPLSGPEPPRLHPIRSPLRSLNALNHCTIECWEMVFQRVKGTSTSLGFPTFSQFECLNGFQMFGFLSPFIVQATEALDPNRRNHKN